MKAQASPHLVALQELYQGEVLGEAMFDAMLDSVQGETERYKIGLMLQLETETKARLRPALAAHGVSLQEDPQMRPRGAQFALALTAASWTAKMDALYQAIAGTYLPRYRELLAVMPPALRALAQSMVEHEQALLEMTRRELDGDSQRSDEPVRNLLAHPLPRPPIAS
jgi:hypothetical protein